MKFFEKKEKKETVENSLEELILESQKRLAKLQPGDVRKVTNSNGDVVDVDMYAEELHVLKSLMCMRDNAADSKPKRELLSPNTVVMAVSGLLQLGALAIYENQSVIPKFAQWMTKGCQNFGKK
jgi:hypothetical protein